MLEDELINKTKQGTCRTTFIASYKVGETIAITFKKKFLYLAKVTHFYPTQLRELTPREAELDGFSSVLDMQKAICELNNIKSLNHWSFITRFKAIPTVLDYLSKEVEQNEVKKKV